MAYARVLKSIYSTISMIKNASQEREELLEKGMVLISSWIALVSRLMQREVTEELVQDTERHVKIFLSAIHDVDTTLLGRTTENNDCDDSDEEEANDKKKKPLIETTGNLSSLLNLPAVMRKFGPLRNYWEGGYKGEGILRLLKPAITQGTHMHWFASAALKKLYHEKSVGLLLKKEGGKNLDLCQFDTVAYRTYKSEEDLLKHVKNKDGISAVVDNDSGKMFCSVSFKKEKKWVELVHNEELCSEMYSTWHCEISLGKIGEKASNNLTNILWLPNREGKENSYYCIDENWLELLKEPTNGKLVFQLPRVYGVKY